MNSPLENAKSASADTDSDAGVSEPASAAFP